MFSLLASSDQQRHFSDGGKGLSKSDLRPGCVQIVSQAVSRLWFWALVVTSLVLAGERKIPIMNTPNYLMIQRWRQTCTINFLPDSPASTQELETFYCRSFILSESFCCCCIFMGA